MKNNFATVDDHIQQLVDKSATESEEAISKFVQLLKLESLSPEDQVLLLHSSLLKVQEEIDSFENKEYILLSNYQETITKIFYHRLLFFGSNDGPSIQKAILINKKKDKLFRLLFEAKSKLPVLIYNDFIQGQKNVVFYELKERPLSTPEEEYHKMRTWQNNHLMKAIELESNHFAKTFHQSFVSDKPFLEQVEQEIQNLQHIFRNSRDNSAEQLQADFLKLKSFSKSEIPINIKSFQIALYRFLKGEIDYSFFTPKNLQNIISDYSKNSRKRPLSYPPVLCYSLMIYGDWLDSLKIAENKAFKPINLDYHSLFCKTYNDACDQSKTNTDEFKAKESIVNVADEYKDLLLYELERLRNHYNELGNKQYFDLMEDDNALESCFLSSCLFSGKPNIQAKELRQSIMINNESDFYFRELVNKYFDPVLMKSIKSLPTIEFQLINLINSMVPDSSTIHKMLTLCSNTIGSLANGRKPYLFVTTDLKDGLLELFDITEAKLYYQLRRLDDNAVYEYTSNQISELKRKSLEAKKNNTGYHPHIDLLTELLVTQFNLIKTAVSPVNIEKLLKTKPIKEKLFSFGYKNSSVTPLESTISRLILNPEIELLDDKTTGEDLIKLLTAKDINSLPFKPIYINCRTNLFSYVVKKFKCLFSHFDPASIEKSGRFYSNQGALFTANNLYQASNREKIIISKKIAIDQIFKQLQ